MNKELIDGMIEYFANNIMLYWKSSSYHWSVTGQDFYQLHLLFEKIYTDVYDNIDVIAEKIRQLYGYPPADLVKLLSLSSITSEFRPETSLEMVKILEADNILIQEIIMKVFQLAQAANDQGNMNYLAERLEHHQKHAWMLRASAKT